MSFTLNPKPIGKVKSTFTYEILIDKCIKLIVKLKLNLTGVLCFSNSGTPAILDKKKGYPFG
jgi:hypothetical protein